MSDSATPVTTPASADSVSTAQELKAMGDVSKALDSVNSDPEALKRILWWLSERYGTRIGTTRLGVRTPAPGEARTDEPGRFGDLAGLIVAASPSTDAERALVGGYWSQVEKQQQEWDSQSVNTQLKHVGHGVGNITDALSSLIERKPQLVIQTRKSGKSRQARKLYKLTTEGVKRVEDLLAKGAETQSEK